MSALADINSGRAFADMVQVKISDTIAWATMNGKRAMVNIRAKAPLSYSQR